ncbi:MAG: hypothetical protein WCX96_03960 [Bacilli bacterium]
MTKKEELIKLRKMVSKLIFSFEEISTNEGFTLIYDGELAENVEVYTYDENGEKIIAPDGVYNIENWGSLTIENGIVIKVEKIQEETETETTETETEVEMESTEVETTEKETEVDFEDKLNQLENKLNQLENKFNDLLTIVNGLVKNVQEFSKQPVDKKIEKTTIKTKEVLNKENKALKYFGK